MKFVKLFLFVIFFAAGIAAQDGSTSVKGNVRSDSGAAIDNAEVTLLSAQRPDVSRVTFTNAEGNFRFEGVLPGEYVVRVRYVTAAGTAVASETELTHNVGRTSLVEVVLSVPGTIRETVTVSANAEQEVDEISKSVNVIAGREMRERADFTLVESLRSIPGFRVQQLGGFGRTANIKTRGLRNQDTALLIDGIRFRDPTAIGGDASPFLQDMTLTSISRIEVLRGPASSLYGTNAIGGTIDFKTPKPRPGWHGQISGNYGGLGFHRFRGNVSKGTDDGRFGFNAAFSRTAYTEGIDDNDDADSTNFQSRIEVKPWNTTTVSARFFISDAFVRLNSDPDTFGVLPPTNAVIIDAEPGVNFTADTDDPDDFQKSNFFSGQVVLTHVFNDKLYFEGYYSGLRTERVNESGSLGVGFQSDSTAVYDGQIHTANGHFVWQPNDVHRVTAGYEFEHERYGNEGFTPGGFGDFFTNAFQSSNTLYAQDLVSLLEGRLQIAGGFRAQMFSLSTPEFSLSNAPYTNVELDAPPSAFTVDGSASYFFEKTGTKLRAHAGTAYNVPSLYQRFGTFFSTFGGERFVPIGAPDLGPERSFGFDAGVEQYALGRRVHLSAVYFYTHLRDTIGYGLLPQPDRWGRDNFDSGGGYLNTKGGISRGLEFGATLRPTDSTDIFASYTFTNSDQFEPQVAGSGVLRSMGIPRDQFTLVATQRVGRFWVNMDLLLTSDYLAPIFSNSTFNSYIYRFDGNRKADVTAGYTFPVSGEQFSLRLYGTIENLLDDEYYENGFRTAGANARIGVSFGF